VSRRARGFPKAFRRESDGRWIGQVELETDATTRARVRRYFKTEREANAWIVQALGQKAQGKLVAAAAMPLGEYLVWWRAKTDHRRRERVRYEYEHLLGKHVTPKLAGTRLDRLTRALLEEFYDGIASLHSRRYVRAVVGGALQYAVDVAELIPTNPSRATRVKLPGKVKRKLWTTAQVQAFLDHLVGHDDWAFWRLSVATGTRLGELLALRWSDVDWDEERINVAQSMTYVPTKGRKPTDPKTDAGVRSIAVWPEIIDALRRQRARIAEARLRVGDRWDDRGLVFPNLVRRPGTPKSTPGMDQSFHRHRLAAGLPHTRPHDLRHFHATELFRLGVHPKAVQQRLGHEGIEVTMNLYTERDESVDRATASTLRDALR
jgi:integrase